MSTSFLMAQTLQSPTRSMKAGLEQMEQAVPQSQTHTLLQQTLKLEPADELRSVQNFQDQVGQTHERFQQYYKGLPVEGGVYSVHSTNGLITHTSGEFYPIDALDVNPALNQAMALNYALNYVSANEYIWENTSATSPETFSQPEGELVVVLDVADRMKAKLAWKLDVYAIDPLYRAWVYIDAQTGAFITENARIHETDANVSGTSLYNGSVNFTADNTSGSSHRLRNANPGIETYNLNNGTNYGSATDFSSSNGTSWSDATGVQAHWGAQETHGYFLSEHARDSYNGTGGVLRSYVHYSTDYVNAFWDGSRMTYGDGDGVSYGPLVSLDITGHEIAHGVTEFTANLVYQRESGALNESFSDIFGEMIEYYATNTNNWQMGTDIGIGGSGALRSMNNPGAFGDPDTYGGTNWTNPECGTPTRFNDYCGVHSNSGVQNKWFYILAIGENGTNDIGNAYNVTGLGRTKAAAIAYRNLSVYLSVNSTFADARAGAIQSAVDLYGAASAEEIATTDAWYAVGVGGEYGSTSSSYCNSNGNNVSDEYIQRVQLGTIDNSNASSPSGGYTDYTGISTDLTKNSGYTITVTPLWTGTVYAEGYSVWIDYNQDGDFGDAGEQVYTQAATTSTPVSGSFTVPSSATDGATRMRVSMKYNGIPTSCESFTYGEVEDYTVTIVGSGGGDTQAPTAPTSLSNSNVTQTTADLSWGASSDNVGVTGYSVYQGSTNIGSVSGTSAGITGLTAGTSYTFSVTAVDAAGNESSASNTTTFTTQSASDTQAPTTPSSLSASNITSSSFDIAWNASTDNVGVTGYNVYLGGTLDGTTNSTSYSFSGLSASTAYNVSVSAYDAAGNTSSQASTNATTSGGGGGSQVLTADFFESGLDGWIDGGSDCFRYGGSRSYEGNRSIRIRDNSNSSRMTKSVDVSGYASVEVEFYFYAYSMENGEDFWLRYNDGSGWVTVASWARGTDFNNNTFYSTTVTLDASSFSLTSNAQFRFQNDASANGDHIYIDAVTITGNNAAVMGLTSGPMVTTTDLGPGPDMVMGLTGGPALEGDWAVYPNPTQNIVNIFYAGTMTQVELYDVTGALVIRKQVSVETTSLDLSDLPAGVYMLTVRGEEDEVMHEKIIKQ